VNYTRRCEFDGSLSSTGLKCMPVSCAPYDAADKSLKCNDIHRCGPALGAVVAQVLNRSRASFNDTRPLTCNAGYQLSSNVPPRCSDACTYAAGHECVPAWCSRPDAAVAAAVNAVFDEGEAGFTEGIPFLSSMQLVCNAGFVARGSSPAECRRSVPLKCSLQQQEHGRVPAPASNLTLALTPKIESGACVPAPCDPLAVPPNAAIASNPANPVHGVAVNVVCNDGYRAVGKSQSSSKCTDPTSYTMRCLGCRFVSLTSEGLHCAPIECALPLDLVFASINPQPSRLPLTFGQQIRIECTPGTSIGGLYASSFNTPLYSTVSTCGAECTFSAVSACSLVRCPDVQAPANSVFVISQRGQVFEALSADSSNARDCLRHNQSITVKCNQGYMAQSTTGTTPLVRAADGSCATRFDLRCQHLNALQTWPPDLHMSEWIDGGMACLPYACGCGFSLACGQFFEDQGAVVSEVSMDGVGHAVSIEVSCKPGHRAIAFSEASSGAGVAACSLPRAYTATCNDCSYLRSQQCAPVTCSAAIANAVVRRLDDGQRDVTSLATYGEKVVVSCNEGFRPAQYRGLERSARQAMPRHATVICADNCSLTPAVMCEPLTCAWGAEESSYSNSTDLLGRNYSHGEHVLVECNRGFYLAGSESCARVHFAECRDGVFERLQQCQPITSSTCGCGVGSCPRYSRSSSEASWMPQDVMGHGEKVTVTCANGYRAVPLDRAFSTCADPVSATVRCTDCAWTRTHVCRPVTCAHNANDTGVIPFATLRAGASAQLACSRGFRIDSMQTSAGATFEARCQDNCELHPAPAHTCRRARCSALDVPHSTLVYLLRYGEAGQVVHGDELLVRCELGFQVFGGGIAACTTEFRVRCDDGQLSNGSLACLPMRCGCGAASCAAAIDNNALSVAPAGPLSHGARARVTCSPGFRAASPASAAAAHCAAPDHYYVNCSDCVLSTQSGNHACTRISCGRWVPPARPERAEADLVASSGALPVRYESSIALSCPPGYRMGTRDAAAQSPPLSVECLSNCGFSSLAPSAPCLRVSCGVLDASALLGVARMSLFNSSIHAWEGADAASTRNLLFGDTLSVTCAPGYMSSRSSADDGCRQSFNLTCLQSGELDGASSRCVARVCGCGSTDACSPASLAADILAHLDPETLPSAAIASGANHSMACSAGHRWVPARQGQSEGQEALTTCTAADTREVLAVCSDCRLNVSGRCARVQCAEFTTQDPHVASWSSTVGSSLAGLVPFGTEVEVLCKPGYRAATPDACSSSLCTARAPSSFKVSCGDGCSFSESKPCRPITCGGTAFLTNARISPIAVAVAGRPAYEAGDRLRVTCRPCFRVWPPQEPAAATCDDKSFDIRCGLDGSWGEPPSCIPITCYVPRCAAIAASFLSLFPSLFDCAHNLHCARARKRVCSRCSCPLARAREGCSASWLQPPSCAQGLQRLMGEAASP